MPDNMRAVRLIDAIALSMKLRPVEGKVTLSNEWTLTGQDIADAPTVDAVPVKHGYWIIGDQYSGDPDIKCSVCNNELSFECGVSKDDQIFLELHYCPHCGAKMDWDSVARGEAGEDHGP